MSKRSEHLKGNDLRGHNLYSVDVDTSRSRGLIFIVVDFSSYHFPVNFGHLLTDRLTKKTTRNFVISLHYLIKIIR